MAETKIIRVFLDVVAVMCLALTGVLLAPSFGLPIEWSSLNFGRLILVVGSISTLATLAEIIRGGALSWTFAVLFSISAHRLLTADTAGGEHPEELKKFVLGMMPILLSFGGFHLSYRPPK